ncbi:MAG TPA: hypothetical protein VFQ86_00300 [Arachidicoccus soli]|nr:hypothetical protein [Arachidicoccus soli]
MKVKYRWSFLFFSFLLFSSFSYGQMLSNEFGQAFSIHPFFDSIFIHRNKIQAIQGHYVYYQLGHSPVDTKDFKRFEFNKKGQLVRRIETQAFLGKPDTIVFVYHYDSSGRCNMFGRYDPYGAYAYTFKFDENGRKIKKAFYQKSKIKFGKNNPFTIDKLEKIYEEKSSYENLLGPNGVQEKETIYNQSNVPYKVIFYYLDNENRVIRKREKLIRTLEQKVSEISYNNEGFIDTVKVKSNFQDQQNKMIVFGYDEKNVLKKFEYQNGKYLYQTQVVYDRNKWFIKDILRQTVATNFMEILEIDTYQHFGEN